MAFYSCLVGGKPPTSHERHLFEDGFLPGTEASFRQLRKGWPINSFLSLLSLASLPNLVLRLLKGIHFALTDIIQELSVHKRSLFVGSYNDFKDNRTNATGSESPEAQTPVVHDTDIEGQLDPPESVAARLRRVVASLKYEVANGEKREGGDHGSAASDSGPNTSPHVLTSCTAKANEVVGGIGATENEEEDESEWLTSPSRRVGQLRTTWTEYKDKSHSIIVDLVSSTALAESETLSTDAQSSLVMGGGCGEGSAPNVTGAESLVAPGAEIESTEGVQERDGRADLGNAAFMRIYSILVGLE